MATAIEISTSALVAQRLRMDTIANNIANVSTTRDAAGKANPYIRKRVVFEVGMPKQNSAQGVHVARVEEDRPSQPGAEPFRLKYEPGNPDADERGYVRYPNVDLTRELVNALEASRTYEANIQAIEVAKSMGQLLTRLLE